jgi:hypothetical protein
MNCTKLLDSTFGSLPPPAVVPAPEPVRNADVVAAMGRAYEQKQALVQKALVNTAERYNVWIVGQDAFNVLDIGFEGVLKCTPSLKTCSKLVFASTICGILAGVLNIAAAIATLKSAKNAGELKDTLSKTRLYMDVLCTFAIGVLMILTSIARELVFLSAVGFFFAANPYLLPLLFFLITFPTILETSLRLASICRGHDWASKLEWNTLREALFSVDGKSIDWEAIEKLKLLEKVAPETEGAPDLLPKMKAKLDELQADIGVEAAIEAFRLLKALHEKKKVDVRDAFLKFEAKVKEWRIAQVKRLAEQLLCGIAFGASMGNLAGSSVSLTAVETGALMSASGISLQMDVWDPFARGSPIVVVEERAT